MNWDDYRLILALVREKSVRGAARSLEVSHATVSRRLAHLNRQPGGPLIQKSPSALWPSKAGAVVFEAAQKMEAIANEAARKQRAVEPRLAGPLCLSVPVPVLQYLLLPAVTEFRELYPAVELTIDATDSLVDLDRAEADIAIRSSDTPPEHWVGRRLFPYMLSFYGHREYLEATRPADYQWIAPEEGITRWPDWLEESPHPEAPVSLRITSIAGRFHALRVGMGIGRAACFMADQEPDLVRISNAPFTAAETFWVLSHPDFAKTKRAKVAMRFFSDYLRDRKGLIQGTS